MTRFRIGPLTVDVVEGDITAERVDAIVNAANTHFWMGAGVAGAIKKRGGEVIEREAVALGPVSPGESVVTTAGTLPARYVIHAAVMGQDLRTDEHLIARATQTALAAAAERGLSSIAFPALGTGVGGFPIGRCAEIMLGAVRQHAGSPSSLTHVTFVLFGESAYQAFVAAARRLLGGGTP